jgi:glycosyltransferase involved in cell wall biosynthesis
MYRDVAGSGHNPFFHYAMWGDKEGRNPGPLFETKWYREKYLAGSNELSLAHYLKHRNSGKFSPFPHFDMVFYAQHNQDVFAAGVDPFEHFVSYGYKEWRNPSAEFDLYFYVKRYLKDQPNEHPFFHYLGNRHKPGVHGRMPDTEVSIPREIKRFTKPSAFFEEYKPVPASAPRRAKVLAYYLPQFHEFPENSAWWGKGFTEWTNIPRGVPRFAGHYQPRIPRDLGYYDLNSTDAMRRQIEMAKGNGVSGFVFYHYWFNGKRLMDMPLEKLLADPTLDMPFSLLWANENWTRRWDGSESNILISQDYRAEDDPAMVADFARHFKDSRYIRVQGRPLFMIYRPGIIPGCAARIEDWRKLFREEHGENPLILMVQAFGDTDPRVFGFDGAVEFPPHKLTQTMRPANQDFDLLDLEFDGKIYHYDAVMRQSLDEAAPPFPLIKTAVPSWDNDARRQGAGLVITGSTPAKYENWLAQLVERAERNPALGEPLVCINAWNEWCEGTYLEPDLHFGSAYLNATGRAACGIVRRSAAVPKLLLIGHDAFPSGAQQLLLNIGRTLSKMFGMEIEFMLLDGGRLESKYREIAPTFIGAAGPAYKARLEAYKERGFTCAIVNTLASAKALPDLMAAGIEATLLVHELPRILKEKNLIDEASIGIRLAKHVVFPAKFVQDAVNELLEVTQLDNQLVQPQGSYKDIAATPEAAARFRAELGIPEEEKLVIGMGYADLRKGFDLFLQVWRFLNYNAAAPVHVCWVGGIDPDLLGWLSGEMELAQASGTFHMIGYVDDVTPAFSAASVFALTSREDPFPTVVLEAVSAGVPVVAFDRSGGMPEVITANAFGRVVSHGNAIAMAEAIRELLPAKADLAATEARRRVVRANFVFSSYVERLRNIALPGPAGVSVAVPNYNYARFMPERLGSIFRQTYPVAEVIVLDDCSSDDSLEVIPKIAADWNRDIKIVANETNSGSVFAQWRKAAELATGDWLWIAEADDSCDATFLESLLQLIKNDSSIVMAFSDSRTIHADGTPQWSSYKAYYGTLEADALTKPAIFPARDFVQRYLGVKNLILNASAVIWKRKPLLRALAECEASLKDYKLAGDWRLYLQVLGAEDAKIAYHPGPLNVHRRHAGSVTHALNHERHVAEIVQCQAFARSIIGEDSRLPDRQSHYLDEVIADFGLPASLRDELLAAQPPAAQVLDPPTVQATPPAAADLAKPSLSAPRNKKLRTRRGATSAPAAADAAAAEPIAVAGEANQDAAHVVQEAEPEWPAVPVADPAQDTPIPQPQPAHEAPPEPLAGDERLAKLPSDQDEPSDFEFMT